MDHEAAARKIRNPNLGYFPLYAYGKKRKYAARGLGSERNPILVEPLEQKPEVPVRHVYKAINRRLKEWLRTNPNVERIETWSKDRTVRTTTYKNVNIVTTDTFAVSTTGFDTIIEL